MQVGEYCNRDVIVIARDETPLTAAWIMRKYDVGDVVIVDRVGSRSIPLGIVTDRDITLEIVAAEVDPRSIAVIDLVLRPLITVSDKDDICACTVYMKSNNVRRAPVVDANGYLIGIITIDDIIEHFSTQLDEVASLVGRRQKYQRRMFA